MLRCDKVDFTDKTGKSDIIIFIASFLILNVAIKVVNLFAYIITR